MSNPTRPTLGGRREAREQALLLAYQVEARSGDLAAVLAEQVIDPDQFTADALAGVFGDLARIDGAISQRLRDWPLDRIAAIDRAVLRVATWELHERPEISTAVVLNEAVELAKRYGTDDSGAFVNGVLSSVARDVRGDTVPPRPPALESESADGEDHELSDGRTVDETFGLTAPEESES